MKLDLDNFEEWEMAQKVTVDFLKDCLTIAVEHGASEFEIKAYLYVISDNTYIGEFKEYAKKNNYEKYCEEIYKNYQD